MRSLLELTLSTRGSLHAWLRSIGDFVQLRTAVACCIALTIQGFACSLCTAQVLASEHGRVSQTVDGTTITVEYYRPVARGRELWGGVVKWGDIWTPGANWATTIEVDRDVRLENTRLPKGKYSVWLQPQKDGDWTIMFSRRTRVLHLWPPPVDDEELRFKVKPEQRPHVEVLTWQFPAVQRDGAALRMNWGTTAITVHIWIEPSQPTMLTAEQRSQYVGGWVVTTNAVDARAASVTRVEIVEANGVLRLKGALMERDFDSEIELNAIGGDQFHPKYYRTGKPIGIVPTVTLIFQVEDGRAISFEVRALEQGTIARAVRTPDATKG